MNPLEKKLSREIERLLVEVIQRHPGLERPLVRIGRILREMAR